MKTKMTGNILMKSPHRMAGTYQIVYEVTTPSGATGLILFVYEYDKRDVMNEEVMTTPEIAEEVREFLGEDSPCVFDCFPFPKEEEENKNGEAITDAIEKATVLVYGYDERS